MICTIVPRNLIIINKKFQYFLLVRWSLAFSHIFEQVVSEIPWNIIVFQQALLLSMLNLKGKGTMMILQVKKNPQKPPAIYSDTPRKKSSLYLTKTAVKGIERTVISIIVHVIHKVLELHFH